MQTKHDKNETAQSDSQNVEQDTEQGGGYIRCACPNEDYWPHDEAGNQLSALGVKLAILVGFGGYDFPCPIPPEVAAWVLANLRKEILEP
jgi:hypothetical protein